VLCMTALFAFGDATLASCQPTPGPPCKLQSLYTLNFESYAVHPIAVFLALYPVLTLSTNFPLISITLRNNLMGLIPWGKDMRGRHIIFALAVVIPPFAIAYATRDVLLLVSITGSYAGLGIMWVIPAFLVMYSRKKLHLLNPALKNPHQSIFHHQLWIWLIFILSTAAVTLITFNHIYDHVHKK